MGLLPYILDYCTYWKFTFYSTIQFIQQIFIYLKVMKFYDKHSLIFHSWCGFLKFIEAVCVSNWIRLLIFRFENAYSLFSPDFFTLFYFRASVTVFRVTCLLFLLPGLRLKSHNSTIYIVSCSFSCSRKFVPHLSLSSSAHQN